MDWHRIPNSVVLAIVGAFYAFAVLKGLDGSTIIAHTAVALVALIAGALAIGGGSAGAVKLTAAVVLWLGFEHGCVFIAMTYLSLAAIAVLLTLAGRNVSALPVMPFAIAALAVMAMTGALPAVLTA